MANILILLAHPELAQSRVCKALLAALQHSGEALQEPEIELRDLYRLYPDYSIDIQAEQRALASAQLVVWLHPLHWYSSPALLKLWIDEVLSFGWAYGPGGSALQGKDLWLVSSSGGAAEDYSAAGLHQHNIADFLLPQAQTAHLCGMRFLPPLILHRAHRVDDEALRQHALNFVQHLLNYPDFCADTPAAQPRPRLDGTARPAPEQGAT